MLQSVIIPGMAAAAFMLAQPAFAACEGGYTYGFCEDRIVHYYDPDTGEICDPLNCGGGRAPVKYDVPGCHAYTGTEVYVSTARFMPCFTSLQAPTVPAAIETTAAVEAEPTEITTATELTGFIQASASEEPESVETQEQEILTLIPPTETEDSSSVVSTTTQESISEKTLSTTTSTTVAPVVNTTPAPTLSTASETDSATTSAPVTVDADSGAAIKQGSFVALMVAALGVFLMN